MIYIIIYIHGIDNMYVSEHMLAINCLEAYSFIVKGMQILLQKMQMYETFAKDLYYIYFEIIWCQNSVSGLIELLHQSKIKL